MGYYAKAGRHARDHRVKTKCSVPKRPAARVRPITSRQAGQYLPRDVLHAPPVRVDDIVRRPLVDGGADGQKFAQFFLRAALQEGAGRVALHAGEQGGQLRAQEENFAVLFQKPAIFRPQDEPAARGDDKTVRRGEFPRRLRFEIAEIPLAALREDVRYLPLFFLVERVGVREAAARKRGDRLPHAGLARAHHAAEYDIHSLKLSKARI